jgi:GT2 family glycosyltransferase
MTAPLISVVLGTYNQKDVLEKVLFSLSKQTMPDNNYEIVVVDSSSNDGTSELLKEFHPNCHFQYFIQENNGKAGARNRGVTAARSEIIIITDADMIADERMIEAHYNAHIQRNEPACFEGITYNLKCLEWPTTTDNTYPYIKGNYRQTARLGWWYFLTGNISFPKNIFEQESGFDESFLNYGWEDLELGYRLSKKKIGLFYLKDAINYHYHVVTKQEEIERNINKGSSASIFLRKHPELKWFLGLNPLSVFIYKIVRKKQNLLKWINNYCFNSSNNLLHKFGFWFLKEYNYLEGLLEIV